MKYAAAILFFVFIVFGLFFVTKPASAIEPCEVYSVSPDSVLVNTSSEFTFHFQNNSESAISWARVTRPNGNFTITGSNDYQWSVSASESTAVFTGGQVAGGGAHRISVLADTNGTPSASANWTLEVSEFSDGSSPATCTGNLATAITDTPPDTSFRFMSIGVTEITSSSVNINYEAYGTSYGVINYGESDSYGNTIDNGEYLGAHSTTISGLAANTTYHYKITISDSGGENVVESSDYTFTTALPGETLPEIVVIAASSNSSTSVTTDTALPVLTVSTDFSKPFKTSPAVRGKATDNVGVEKLYYSLDGGKNWLTVKITPGKTVNFNFTPLQLEDGNYDFVLRAEDAAGNQARSTATLVIDTLPPNVGGNNIFLGPQNVFPGLDGTITAVMGTTATIAVNSVGGPISIDFLVGDKAFPFHRVGETNIWKGEVKFESAGKSDLKVISLDGANNRTERIINQLNILPSGTISSSSGETIDNALVTVFTHTDSDDSWEVWDAGVYGQENPVRASGGKYGFFLPKGQYYLKVEKDGYRSSTSEIFKAPESGVVNSDVTLVSRPTLNILGSSITLPSFLDIGESTSSFPVSFTGQNNVGAKNPLVGTKIDNLNIQTTDGKVLTINDLKGTKTIITFLLLNTWSPASQDQISILDRLGEKGFTSLPIFLMESPATVKGFLRRGGYTINAGVDPTGELLKIFPVTSMPQHFFVDEQGIVREVVVGSKSQSELGKILEGIN